MCIRDSINTGGSGGDGGTSTTTGSYGTANGNFPGMQDGSSGADGTGSKLMVGAPDNQASDPGTGGAGGGEIFVPGKGGGGNGINVKIGDAGTNVVFVPGSNGVFNFNSVGNNITAVEFELQGGAGANSNVLPLHNYGTNVFGARGKGEKINITIKETFLSSFKTKIWKAYLGGGAVNASKGTINGTAGTPSMYGGNGGAGSTTTNTNYWSISTDTWGGGGGAATHLYADTQLAAGLSLIHI